MSRVLHHPHKQSKALISTLVTALLFLLPIKTLAGSIISSGTATLSDPSTTKSGMSHPTHDSAPSDDSQIRIVFSDVDGTLVHYPNLDANSNIGDDENLLYLPPSSTGMKGVISYKTLKLCSKIRKSPEDHVKLVLVSGMRTSTLMSRLPHLPVADAYCSEGGGRIFYPTPISENDDNDDFLVIYPKNGESPFRLVEDMEWRKKMEDSGAAGFHGYESKNENVCKDDKIADPQRIDIEKREGLLWGFARNLIHKGWVLDTKGYSTCFRVNRKKQTESSKMDENFDNLSSFAPEGIASSVNLGCVDFYPSISGKKNCCQYLVKKYLMEEDYSKKSWVCLCDDDNDLEMAMYCHHAYIPCLTSESMKKVISTNPDHFSVTCNSEWDREGVYATEYALQLILEKIGVSSNIL